MPIYACRLPVPVPREFKFFIYSDIFYTKIQYEKTPYFAEKISAIGEIGCFSTAAGFSETLKLKFSKLMWLSWDVDKLVTFTL